MTCGNWWEEPYSLPGDAEASIDVEKSAAEIYTWVAVEQVLGKKDDVWIEYVHTMEVI